MSCLVRNHIIHIQNDMSLPCTSHHTKFVYRTGTTCNVMTPITIPCVMYGNSPMTRGIKLRSFWWHPQASTTTYLATMLHTNHNFNDNYCIEKLIQFGKVGKVQAKDPGLVLRIIIRGETRRNRWIRESQTFHSLPVVCKSVSKARIRFTGIPALQIGNSHIGRICPCTSKILQRIH